LSDLSEAARTRAEGGEEKLQAELQELFREIQTSSATACASAVGSAASGARRGECRRRSQTLLISGLIGGFPPQPPK